jgi:GNAT superfamily N-acetyltransferase
MDGPRTARRDELAAIVSLVNRVFCRDGGRTFSMERSFPRLFSTENLDNLYVMFDGPRLVSFLAVDFQDYVACGCRLPLACLGAVCTEMDYRGQGLSTALLEAAYARLRAKGRLMTIISGSRSLYYRTGAAPGVFAMCQWTADVATLRAVDDASLRLEPLDRANLRDLAALNAREPMRFDWTEDWLRTVPLALCDGEMGRGWIIRRDGQAVAAACLAAPAYNNQPTSLLDWFGDRRAVVASLARMLEAAGTTQVSCRMVLHDAAMLEAVRRAGIEPQRKTPWPWPIKVLDFAGLLAALEPHLRRTLGDQAASVAATADGIRVRADGCDFTPPDEAAAAQMLLAMPDSYGPTLAACPEPVRALMARAFPIPMRHYGLNYI